MAKLVNDKVATVKIDRLSDLPDYAEETKRKEIRFCHDCPFGSLDTPAVWRVRKFNNYGQTISTVYVCDGHKALYTELP